MENLYELRDRVMTLPTLENRLAAICGELNKAEGEVAELLRQYERERRDVEQIQNESLSSFFYKVIGKYEDRLEKERREEICAKLAYDRAVTRLDDLKSDKNMLAGRISDLRADERVYNDRLQDRRRELQERLSKPEGARYAELENNQKAIISRITEIKEALNAAARAKTTAQNALESLKSAEKWATYDAFTRGGIISHMAKYSHIDTAERCFHALSSQLRDLKAELSDVQGLTASGFNDISSTQRTIDFWFDNIFTDLSVRAQIKDNAEEVERLLDIIYESESALITKLREEEATLANNRKLEEDLLLELLT